jgi:hypothetical protein
MQMATIFTQRVLPESISVTGNTVVFSPLPQFGTTFTDTLAQGNISGEATILCRIVVKCHYLTDSQDRPVDGDFLKGSLPSGDGVPGGDFESWFVLTP